MCVSHIEFAHGGELFRAGRVHDLEHNLPAIDVDLLSVGVLDGGVIALYENALDELRLKGLSMSISTSPSTLFRARDVAYLSNSSCLHRQIL